VKPSIILEVFDFLWPLYIPDHRDPLSGSIVTHLEFKTWWCATGWWLL